MSDGILPALLALSIEGELSHDVLVDLTEGAHLVRGGLDSHGDEGDVGVGGLGHCGVASLEVRSTTG